MKLKYKSIVYLIAVLLMIIAGCKKGSKSPVEDPKKETPVKESDFCKSCKKVKSAVEISALTLKPGDTIIMESGDWVNQKITFKGNGTFQLPIVLIAEKAGQVNLKGTSSLIIDGSWLVVDGLNFKNGDLSVSKLNVVDFTAASRNCRLTNTSIVDYNPPDQSIDYRWISLNGKNHRVDHCYLKGKAHLGPTVVIWGANDVLNHRIDHNYFGARPELGSNGGETIRIGTSTYYLSESLNTIEENIFDKCNGETEIISNKMSRNTIRNNFFFESRGTLCLRHGNNSEVYGNYLVGNNVKDAGGIRIVGEGHLVYNNYLQGIATTGQTCAVSLLDGVPSSEPSGYFQVKNVKIVGNTIVNCAQGFDIGAGKGGNNRTIPPANCVIANNVLQLKAGASLIRFTDIPENFFYEGNVGFGMGAVSDPLAGFLIEDPKLVRNEFMTYTATSNSPVLGAFRGTYTFFQSTDAGANNLDDLHKKLLKAKDVGPLWVTGLGDQMIIKE
ncbi:Chondroitinase-B precursor [compost metagenome]